MGAIISHNGHGARISIGTCWYLPLLGIRVKVVEIKRSSTYGADVIVSDAHGTKSFVNFYNVEGPRK